MKKNSFIKKNILVSIAVLSAVLTFMLGGCKKTDNQPGKNAGNGPQTIESQRDNQLDNSSETESENQTEEFDATVTLTGGTGKAKIESAHIFYEGENMMAAIVWSSKSYDYMIVDGEKYLPVNGASENSSFIIPVKALDRPISVAADTTAMSKPHEIQYEITFSKDEKIKEETEDSDLYQEDSSFKKGVSSFGTLSKDIEEWLSKQNITNELKTDYAQRFRVLFLGDNPLIIINNSDCYYLISSWDATNEGIDKSFEKSSGELSGEMDENYSPEELMKAIPEDITVLNAPVSNIYVAGTASMDYFASIDALSNIGYSSISSDNWENEAVRALMDKKEIAFAGKYSAPDYEKLLAGGCQLALENTMISHSPEVIEKLKDIGIPTLIDYSSYEPEPLGRMEWVKLYGVLTGRLSEAEKFFKEKESLVSAGFEKTDYKVAFFYINNSGAVVVRKNQDYAVSMINIAGGNYCLEKYGEYDGTGGMNIQAESFYGAVTDCDYFIYNTNISGDIESINDLEKKCPVLRNTKAVKNGNVFVIDRNFYQSPMSISDYIMDINQMLTGGKCKYLRKIM